EYMDKIKSGSVFEVAEVYRDLLILKLEKDLSFGERKMLDTARNLLVKEISLAEEIEEAQVEKDLDRIFS
ncbi:MAG: CarD family transcriptional regulator, partial [Deltaproteobacteria bacterium]|nr:CarD family transcriptional regulator [Deltaproteobacteria bacterium]